MWTAPWSLADDGLAELCTHARGEPDSLGARCSLDLDPLSTAEALERPQSQPGRCWPGSSTASPPASLRTPNGLSTLRTGCCAAAFLSHG